MLLLHTMLCLDTMFVYYVCILWYVCIACSFTVQRGTFPDGLSCETNKILHKNVEFEQTVTHILFSCFTGMALGYPPPSPVGQFAPLTPINMSAGIDLNSSGGGGGSYSPPHNLSPKGGASSATINGYNSQVGVI